MSDRQHETEGPFALGVIGLKEWNEKIVSEFRANNGRIRWSDAADLAAGRPIPPAPPGVTEPDVPPIILVRHFGAKTGLERISPLAYLPVGENFAVFASYGGSPRHPAWYHNLLARPMATIETGLDVVSVRARVAEGDERAQIWSAQAAMFPVFEEYQAATSRQIPVVLLERIDGHPEKP